MPTIWRYLCLLSVLSGTYVLPSLFLGDWQIEQHILLMLKVPVLLTAILVGASITSASAALQVTLNNPLADPGIIGISSGASLMAAVFLVLFSAMGKAPQTFLFSYSMFVLPFFCFVGAILSTFFIYLVAKRIGQSVASFILAGIAISTVFSALVGWIYLSAPPHALQSLTFWLMGSLSYTNYQSVLIAGILMLAGLLRLFVLAQKLNLLYLGDQAATAAGVDTKKLQQQLFLIVGLLVGVSVSIAGSIAFLGLLVPHAVRRLHGYDNKKVLLYSGLLGSCVLMSCAIINEYLFVTAVPLSMLTASIGAPMFIYILFAKNKRAT